LSSVAQERTRRCGGPMIAGTANLQPEKRIPEPQSLSPTYRPDEGDRLRRAKEWIAVARGETKATRQMTGTTHMRLPILIGGDVCAFCVQKQERRRAWLPGAFTSNLQGQNSASDAISKASASPERNVLTSCNRPRPQTTCDVPQSTKENPLFLAQASLSRERASSRFCRVVACVSPFLWRFRTGHRTQGASWSLCINQETWGALCVAAETLWKRHCITMLVLNAVTDDTALL
jgi:hypothetical protein